MDCGQSFVSKLLDGVGGALGGVSSVTLVCVTRPDGGEWAIEGFPESWPTLIWGEIYEVEIFTP